MTALYSAIVLILFVYVKGAELDEFGNDQQATTPTNINALTQNITGPNITCNNITIRAVRCSDVGFIFEGIAWNNVTAKGVLLSQFTDDQVKFIGCSDQLWFYGGGQLIYGNCPVDSFYCIDEPNGIRFGTTAPVTLSPSSPGVLRATLNLFPDPAASFYCQSSSYGNAPFTIQSVSKLCEQLGYASSSFEKASTNYCYRLQWDNNAKQWEMEGPFIGYGRSITCSDPCVTIDFPDECTDKCDAFSILLDTVQREDDSICITYMVNRLFSDGKCYKSVKEIILGLCEEDRIGGKCNNNNLDELIESVYSENFPLIRAFGSRLGIRIDFGQKVEGDGSFELCLKDVFEDDTFSNIVAFKKKRKRYLCKEDYLFGLPCLNESKFSDGYYKYGHKRYYRYQHKRHHGMSVNEESDQTEGLEATSSFSWTSLKGILIVLGVVFVLILIGFGVWCIVNWRKKKDTYDVVENVDNNTGMGLKDAKRTNIVDCEAEMVETQQCINKDFVQ